jgi:hypothetical protein
MMEHRYQKKMMELMPLLAAMVPKGSLAHLDVRHDDDCAFLRGGICACDADFYVYGKKIGEDAQ